MQCLSLDDERKQNPEALRWFLEACRNEAVSSGHARLVSISIAVKPMDPLAVLESIYEDREQHFYIEKPDERFVLAGADAVVSCRAQGPNRFREVKAWADDVLAHTVAVGDLSLPFSGPHFFSAFAFFNEVATEDSFPASFVFVPRWQVSRRNEQCTAVANLLIDSTTDIDRQSEKVWRAHSKFQAFEYPDVEPEPDALSTRNGTVTKGREIGEAGAFKRNVSSALEAITAGEFGKIVLARAIEVEFPEPLHPMRSLNSLRNRYPGCYTFSCGNGAGQSFIGASPERFLKVAGGVLLTEALAGSAPRGRSALEDALRGRDLLESEKEAHEHAVVLKSILRRLRPLGIEPSYPDAPHLVRLANVQHLHTPLEASLPESRHILDLVEALHPTPAVGGTPWEKVRSRIEKLEPFSRGLYAGPTGWFDHTGHGEFCVAIRSALIHGNRARLFAGAGIVEGSDPQKEWEETELKFKALLEALA